MKIIYFNDKNGLLLANQDTLLELYEIHFTWHCNTALIRRL